MAGTDSDEYGFLILPGAELAASLHSEPGSPTEIRLFGNRSGFVSLAGVLLWLRTNSWRCEFLSITGLRFVRNPEALHLMVRVADSEPNAEWAGYFQRIDKGVQFEWVHADDELRKSALTLHNLACNPMHEYDLLPCDDALVRDARLHVRRTDIDELRRAVNEGIEQLERGEGVPMDIEEIKAAVRSRVDTPS